MLARAAFVLLSALAVSANSLVPRLVTSRQVSSSSVPSACQSTCSSALTIYNACLSGDTTTCLTVCQTDTYNNFVSCLNCVVQETADVNQGEIADLQEALDQLQLECAEAGESVTANASLVSATGAESGPSGSETASETLTGVLGTITSDSISFTSDASGVTVGVASTTSAAAAATTGATTSAAGTSKTSSTAASSAAASSGLPGGGAVTAPVNSGMALGGALLAAVAGPALLF